MDVIGRDGVSLREQWGDEPTAYLGITIPNFPNLFCIYGPGTNLASRRRSVLPLRLPGALRHGRHPPSVVVRRRTIEVRKDAHDEYVERYQAEIGQLVWSHPAITHSHYKNPQGKIFTLSPWPIEQYWEWTRHVNRSHYSFA